MRKFSVDAVFAFMTQMLAEGEACSFARRDNVRAALAAISLRELNACRRLSRPRPLPQSLSHANVPPVGSGQLAPVPASPQ